MKAYNIEKTEWWFGVHERVKSWLPTVHSEAPGLYRLSRHAFHPYSIDATSLALDLYQILGIDPPAVQLSFDFFNQQQEEGTGFYHEPFVSELDLSVDRILEMSGTYLGYQVAAILLAFGQRPRYPYRFYEQFLSSGAIEKYMNENMPWERAPMGAGNMVDHGTTMMRVNLKFFDKSYEDVLKRMYNWLDNHQNPDTGLWGSECAQGKNGLVQGGYHLMRGLYFYDDRSPNYPEKITDTLLASIAETAVFCNGSGEGCHDMDHFVVLERMLRYTNGYREFEARKACENRLSQLRFLHQKDGGFSFEAEGSIANHNRYEVTPGYKESDLAGTVFYLETIFRILCVLGIKPCWSSSRTHGVII